MAKKKKQEEVWKDDFEDIVSHSPGSQPNPAEEEVLKTLQTKGKQKADPAQKETKQTKKKETAGKKPEKKSGKKAKKEQEWDLPQWETPSKKRTSPPKERPRSGPESRPVTVKKKKKGTASVTGFRRVILLALVLVMAVITALLAIFLLFKISDIQVTGDEIDGYEPSNIIKICGYQTGENLVFLPTREPVEKLKEKMPYIGDARIVRHFPGTLEIRVKAAHVSANMYSDGDWLVVSSTGKVLEKADGPRQGVMQIIGLTLPSLQVGQTVDLQEPELPRDASELAADSKEMVRYEKALQAYQALTAYRDIAGELAELDAESDFTCLDLTDASDIKLYYQERVLFSLGGILELPYKVDLGVRSLTEWEAKNPGLRAEGTMDLSHAGETKTAVFTDGEVTLPAMASGEEPSTDEKPPEQAPEPTPAPESPRGDDIPNSPFNGG